jgi:hypothetical protein
MQSPNDQIYEVVSEHKAAKRAWEAMMARAPFGNKSPEDVLDFLSGGSTDPSFLKECLDLTASYAEMRNENVFDWICRDPERVRINSKYCKAESMLDALKEQLTCELRAAEKAWDAMIDEAPFGKGILGGRFSEDKESRDLAKWYAQIRHKKVNTWICSDPERVRINSECLEAERMMDEFKKLLDGKEVTKRARLEDDALIEAHEEALGKFETASS